MITREKIQDELKHVNLRNDALGWYQGMRGMLLDDEKRKLLMMHPDLFEQCTMLYQQTVEILANTLIANDKRLVDAMYSFSSSSSRTSLGSFPTVDVAMHYQQVMHCVQNDFRVLRSIDAYTLAYEHWIRIAHRCLYHHELIDINMMFCIVEALLTLGKARIAEITLGISSEAYYMAEEIKYRMQFDHEKKQYPHLIDKLQIENCIPYLKLYLLNFDPTIDPTTTIDKNRKEKIFARLAAIRKIEMTSPTTNTLLTRSAKLSSSLLVDTTNSKLLRRFDFYNTNHPDCHSKITPKDFSKLLRCKEYWLDKSHLSSALPVGIIKLLQIFYHVANPSKPIRPSTDHFGEISDSQFARMKEVAASRRALSGIRTFFGPSIKPSNNADTTKLYKAILAAPTIEAFLQSTIVKELVRECKVHVEVPKMIEWLKEDAWRENAMDEWLAEENRLRNAGPAPVQIEEELELEDDVDDHTFTGEDIRQADMSSRPSFIR